jgi:hypothetical protein
MTPTGSAGTSLTYVSSDKVDEAGRFRARAIHCRELATNARDEQARQALTEMADDLEDEADKIDDEEATARPKDA